ncbi:MAG TPA: hypothetical protein VII06_04910, partial [Chloroflexota bacterium]
MTPLRAGWAWLAERPHQLLGIRLLQGAIGLQLLFRAATEAPFAGYLWGPHGLGAGSTQPMLGPTLGGLVDRVFASEAGTLAVLGALAVGALGLLVGYRTDVATALALAAVVLLEQRLPDLAEGGDLITRLVLIYLLFTLPAGAKPARGSVAVWLHNVAVLAIGLQVVVLYLDSGLTKAYGEKWQHGTALYFVSQLEWMFLRPAREWFKNPLLTTAATYASLLYEVLFPVAVISPLKLWWLGCGFLLHLAIGVLMGLTTFSIVMIGLLLFFITDTEYARLWAWARRAWQRAAPRLR